MVGMVTTKAILNTTNCTANMTLSGNQIIGGFLGYIGNFSFFNMYTCFCKGIINSNANSSHNIGYLNHSTVNITNSSAVCNIITTSSYAVGFIMNSNYSTITFVNLTSNGTLTATGNYSVSFAAYLYYCVINM
jgi:hypothetical protein